MSGSARNEGRGPAAAPPPEPPDLFPAAVDLHRAGRFAEAEALYRRILAEGPATPGLRAPAASNLGAVLRMQDRLEEAVEAFRLAVDLAPDLADLHGNLAGALKALGRTDEAVLAYRRTLALKPDHFEGWYGLGVLLREQERLEEAEGCFRRAVALRPDSAEAHAGLGVTVKEQGRIAQALACYETALARKPGLFPARMNRQLTRLLLGDFAGGWDAAEYRDWFAVNIPKCWDGGDPAGRTVLVYNVEGFGDAIHFARYVPRLAARGARIVLEIEPELGRLMGTLAGVAEIVVKPEPRPPFDAQVFFQQFPHAFATRRDTIPAEVPYLHADPALVRRWRERLGARRGPRVGLAWAGSTTHPNDRNRSLTLDALAPLAAVPGVAFYALQKGPAAAQAARPPAGMDLTDLGPELRDFADTAAVLMNLDLLIAVDTSIVHLAGALGRPAWALLPFVPDFRWLLETEVSPWYPTLRLFRQSRRGAWEDVVRRVAAALANGEAVRPDHGGDHGGR